MLTDRERSEKIISLRKDINASMLNIETLTARKKAEYLAVQDMSKVGYFETKRVMTHMAELHSEIEHEKAVIRRHEKAIEKILPATKP